MGLLDWLTGKKDKAEIAPDRIWLSQRAKIAGIGKEVAKAVADPSGPYAVIVVAHFKSSVDQLQAVVAGYDKDRVILTLADALGGRTPTDLATDDSRGILIIVGERHPLASHDDLVADFARSWPCRCRLVHHLSMEDPLVKLFGGEWIEQWLRKLGMKNDECIESRVVGRRIRVAQEKIAKSTTSDTAANSAEEWFEQSGMVQH